MWFPWMIGLMLLVCVVRCLTVYDVRFEMQKGKI
jgi:hypothetical protein